MSSTIDKAASESDSLPQVSRFITTHSMNGSVIFRNDSVSTSAISDSAEWETVSGTGGVRFILGYATSGFPVNMSSDNDLAAYAKLLRAVERPGLVIPGGTVLRMMDTPPRAISPMHRTVSLDYGIVLEGEVDLIPDSDGMRRLKRGDNAIQRGTNHAWRNPSQEYQWGGTYGELRRIAWTTRKPTTYSSWAEANVEGPDEGDSTK